jgi:hypothetical protein
MPSRLSLVFIMGDPPGHYGVSPNPKKQKRHVALERYAVCGLAAEQSQTGRAIRRFFLV